MTSWRILTFPFSAEFNNSLQLLHHAAQFVGMFSNSYLPKQVDDGQSNLGWHFTKNAITSHVVDNTSAFLDIQNWEWKLVNNEDNHQFHTRIGGKTKTEAFQWFRSQLKQLGFDQDRFEYFKHFSLPSHELDQGFPFANLGPTICGALTNMLSNASIILQEIIETLEDVTSSPVRIWPHHFDMASLITIETDTNNNPSKTIGIGWAMPDDEINEPYFYTNHWVKQKEVNYDNLPTLDCSGRWHKKDWVGIIIKYSDLLDSTDQYEAIKDYFTESINITKQILTDLKPT